ncbi:hypothetical protein DTL42_18310 [Bremerella cremea]|uniref:Uncharacterized protein n=1 Tax=Bremerella cremea TaxID=1031537 RepID=A0A368KMR1_9BACT|nr:hypothetical protein [Bremerella cremea]RCS43940.1 hypothetical protein DTL42_18310 [Bremerella cremea]
MHSYLRQATDDQSRVLGPFLDDSDGKSPRTDLTIGNTEIQLIPNGGVAAAKHSGGASHRVNGEYSVTFDEVDTANVGELTVSVIVAGALPVRAKFIVLEEVVYDALFAPGSAVQVDLIDTPNAAASANLATSLLDLVNGVETDWTLRQLFRLTLALYAGNSTGGGTSFANPAGTKTRLQANVDSSGNRTVTNKDVT